MLALLAAAALGAVAEETKPKAQKPPDNNPPTLPLGAVAPDFVLTNVDGRVYSLKDFAAAKVLVLVFTSTHCPSAQLNEDRIRDIVTDYKDKGVALAAIMSSSPKGIRLDELGWTDLDDSKEAMPLRAKDRGYNYPFLYDGDSQTASIAYGPVATPHYFVFDAERKLRYCGRLDDDERGKNITKNFVRDAIDAVLAGKEPPVTQNRPVGCSTKWATKEPQVNAWNAKVAAEPVTLEVASLATLTSLRTNGTQKVRVINFWATWCAPCVAEYREFVENSLWYRTRACEFVSVSLNKPSEQADVLAFLKSKQSSIRNLILGGDDRDPFINAFDPKWTGEVPYTVIITPEGEIVHKQSGSVDFLALRRALLKELNARRAW